MKHISRAIAVILILSGCAVNTTGIISSDEQHLSLTKQSFLDLKGWADDNHASALEAFLKSCDRILKQDPYAPFGRNGVGGLYGDWKPACDAGIQLKTSGAIANPLAAKQYFEKWFDPYQARKGFETKGLFTGYYEATLYGSRTRHHVYQTPLYKRPPDLVMVELGNFRDDLMGRRVAGRINESRLKPYETRAEIESGSLAGQNLELVWVSDPVDVFFLHIQGSGQVNLDDGTVMRVGYDGQNGHPYHAIGRELVDRGELDKEAVSLQTIKEWMKTNPEQAQDLKNMNPSFIFFKEMTGSKPLGSEGVPLTAHRSLAVDRTYIPMSTPMWVSADHPLYEDRKIQTLMVAQDTGGAIRGPIRGDFFWGEGKDAEILAGNMKSQGQYWLLLPKRMTVLE